MEPVLDESPLGAWHRAHGARMGAFAGWAMPLEYEGTGSLAEHAAVRSGSGVFDVSHLGTLTVQGAAGGALLNDLLTNDLLAVSPGRAQYTLLLNEQGGIVDDLLAYRVRPDLITVVPNAANNAAVAEVLREHAQRPGYRSQVTITDDQRSIAVLAVQGPGSGEILARLGLPVDLPYLGCVEVPHPAGPLALARSGYTGERGFEILVPVAQALALWQAVVTAGALPVGLIARDILRTEMGYPLHGQDIGPDVTPGESGLDWAVARHKPHFRGRAALLAHEPRSTLLGLMAVDRGIARSGMAVLWEGKPIGHVTSGAFSPVLGRGIALARVATAGTGPAPDTTAPALGDEVVVSVRGRAVAFTVTRPPFVASRCR